MLIIDCLRPQQCELIKCPHGLFAGKPYVYYVDGKRIIYISTQRYHEVPSSSASRPLPLHHNPRFVHKRAPPNRTHPFTIHQAELEENDNRDLESLDLGTGKYTRVNLIHFLKGDRICSSLSRDPVFSVSTPIEAS